MTTHSTQPARQRPDRPGQEAPGRVWLDVPYAEKDSAKAAGARWDPGAKRWFDPRPGCDGRPRPELAGWAAQADVPDLLPGEDRTFGSGLFVDMVPRSCWFTNVRTCVEQRDWERLRRMITGRAEHRCEICGRGEDRETQRRLEAHERWSYDETTGVQTLRRLVCLCSDCHLATHMGYANVTGRSDEAIAHLREVTGMTHTEAMAHIDAAGQLWTARSARTWALDLSMLTDAGVTLAQPDNPPIVARPPTAGYAKNARPPDRLPHAPRRPPRRRSPPPGNPSRRPEPASGAATHEADPRALPVRPPPLLVGQTAEQAIAAGSVLPRAAAPLYPAGQGSAQPTAQRRRPCGLG